MLWRSNKRANQLIEKMENQPPTLFFTRTYTMINNTELFEKYWGDFEFFEFYCESLPGASDYKQLFPEMLYSFVFTSSNALYSTAGFWSQVKENKNAALQLTEEVTYGKYNLKDIDYEKFELTNATSFLQQFERYSNEVI